jgi:hypothetical protein
MTDREDWDDPQEDDFFVMKSAREGDYTLLIEALKTGEWKVDANWRRDLLIEILEGVRRPNHRQRGTIKNLQRKADIYVRVNELIDEGWPLTAADAKVAEEMRCSVKTVSNIRIWMEQRNMMNADWFLVLELARLRKKADT